MTMETVWLPRETSLKKEKVAYGASHCHGECRRENRFALADVVVKRTFPLQILGAQLLLVIFTTYYLL